MSGFYGRIQEEKRTGEKEKKTFRWKFDRFCFSLTKENPEDIQTIDSCEYIWEAGVGFSQTSVHVPIHDRNRTEILKLLLTCFSETIYLTPSGSFQKSNFSSRTFFDVLQLNFTINRING